MDPTADWPWHWADFDFSGSAKGWILKSAILVVCERIFMGTKFFS